MTKPFDIKKYNSLCAELLGFENKTPDDKDFNIHFHKDEKSGKGVEILGTHITSIETNFGRQFTTDWNWIMEVIEAIELKFPKYILQWEYDNREEFAENGNYKAYWFTLYPKDEICSGLSDLRSKSRKEAVVQSIWAFLNWYKEQK